MAAELIWSCTVLVLSGTGFAIMTSLIPINTLIFKRLSAYRQQMLAQVTSLTVCNRSHAAVSVTFCPSFQSFVA
jgi:hypothetical protein